MAWLYYNFNFTDIILLNIYFQHSKPEISLKYLALFDTTESDYLTCALGQRYDANEKFIFAWDEKLQQPKCWSRRSLLPLDIDEV